MSTVAHIEAPRITEKKKIPDLQAALHWLINSKIHVREGAEIMRGGYGNFIDGRTGDAPMLYCEITGYASQFWLRQGDEESISRARDAGDCLLRIQTPADKGDLSGAFPYGLIRPEGEVIPAYFSFDAGVCASALSDLAVKTAEERYLEGAIKVGKFLIRMQAADGSFTAMRSLQPDYPGILRAEGWFGDRCALHGKNAIALLKLWRLTDQTYWKDAACRTLDWVCGLQGTQGEFPWWSGAPRIMTHTHCYATEALLYAGLVLGEERYLTAGIRGARWLLSIQRKDGAFYQDYLSDNPGSTRPAHRSPLHIGPIAQAARIWWAVAHIAPDSLWAAAAARSLGLLSRVQAQASNRWGGGAFPRSARRYGPWYHRHAVYSSWEAMFACEAVRLWTAGFDYPCWSIF